MEIVLALIGVTVASMAAGLAVSAAIDNADRGMPLLVLLAMLQFILSKEPIDGENSWILGGVTQGGVYKSNGMDGSVLGLFCYSGSRYMFAIDANDVASVNDIFSRYVRLRTLAMMLS